MRRTAKSAAIRQGSTTRAQRVGIAELRGNLAKYLKRARGGTPVIIQERGRSAYVLSRLDEETVAPIFGCMRERTEYKAGAVVNAAEPWAAGDMP